jgi:hypothetical protein
MNYRITMLILVLTLGLAANSSLVAGEQEAKPAKPAISATQTVQVETVVEAVDYEARTVTLKGPQGNLKTIKAENTPNLEEVQVGDHVNIEFMENLTIEVVTAEGAEPGQGVMTAKSVNSPDEAPGGMEMATTVTTAIVEEINIEANTFKLKMPGGEIREFTAANPENLKAAAVGDVVIATHTEAIAIYLAEISRE